MWSVTQDSENASTDGTGLNGPKSLIRKFKEREDRLRRTDARLEDERWEPWFPDALIDSIQTTTSVDPRKRHGLLQALWDALNQLKDARLERDRGLPTLDRAQRAKLRSIEAAALNSWQRAALITKPHNI